MDWCGLWTRCVTPGVPVEVGRRAAHVTCVCVLQVARECGSISVTPVTLEELVGLSQ